jgi:hypothetical protein
MSGNAAETIFLGLDVNEPDFEKYEAVIGVAGTSTTVASGVLSSETI